MNIARITVRMENFMIVKILLSGANIMFADDTTNISIREASLWFKITNRDEPKAKKLKL